MLVNIWVEKTHTGEEFEKVLNEFGDQGRECVGHGMTDSRKVYIYSKVSKALISTQLPSKHYFFFSLSSRVNPIRCYSKNSSQILLIC